MSMMEPISGFCDLCVLNSQSSEENLKQTCLQLESLGYKTVAINYFFEENTTESKKKKKKGEIKEVVSDIVPPPMSLDFLKATCKRLKIIHRLTVKFSDGSIIVKLNQSLNIRKYTLLAALPITQASFQIACSTFDADIITFDSENKNSLKLTRKLYTQAINRGIVFELMYSPAILDSTNRKNIIHMSHLYHAIGKSRNIIISSWASDPIQVRGPYDVMNLGLIFGLSEEQAKYAITTVCRQTILRANGRRNGKSLLFVIQDEVEDDWNGESDSTNMVVDTEICEDNQPATKKIKQSNI